MKTIDIYNLAVRMGMDADFRGRGEIERLLQRRKDKYQKLSAEEKEEIDPESLESPYSDSCILHLAQDKEIKKVLVGIDIQPSEVLLAKELGGVDPRTITTAGFAQIGAKGALRSFGAGVDPRTKQGQGTEGAQIGKASPCYGAGVDLLISHHPLGKGLANLHEVMELQCDILKMDGVPINVAEGLMRERISEVARGLNAANHQRTVDAAKLLGFNLICLHTVCDNLAAKFLKEKIDQTQPERIEDLMAVLKQIPEYKEAMKFGAGPKIFVGQKENRCGKISLLEITGGTEGSPKLYEKMATAGIGTVVGMHISEEHKKEAEAAHINIVIAGHISSDSLGMNLLLDELEKQGIEIVPCSGLIRISRNV